MSDRKILVADDNPINLKLMSSLLGSYGAEVLSAVDGRMALEMALSRPVDMVFMDVHMPRLNGIEAARELRRQMGKRKIPVVALTADAMEKTRNAIMAAGMDGYLVKPLEETRLRRQLRMHLGIGGLSPDDHDDVDEHQAAVRTDAVTSQYPSRDPAQALRIAGGSKSIADKLFNALMQELPGSLGELQQYYDERSWSEMWQQAHRLHGAAAVCGVPALHHSLNRLQQSIKKGNEEQIALHLAAVQQEADRLTAIHATNHQRVS